MTINKKKKLECVLLIRKLLNYLEHLSLRKITSSYQDEIDDLFYDLRIMSLIIEEEIYLKKGSIDIKELNKLGNRVCDLLHSVIIDCYEERLGLKGVIQLNFDSLKESVNIIIEKETTKVNTWNKLLFYEKEFKNIVKKIRDVKKNRLNAISFFTTLAPIIPLAIYYPIKYFSWIKANFFIVFLIAVLILAISLILFIIKLKKIMDEINKIPWVNL